MLFLGFLQDKNQDGYADYDEYKINGNEVGDKVDLEYRNHSSQIEIEANYKQYGNGLPRSEPEFFQPVMKMIGVLGERADPFYYSPGKCEGGIRNGDQQSDNWNEIVNFVRMALIERKKSDE